jgi:hypothetical protein
MSRCQYCHKSVSESQIICLHCGCQIRALQVKRRFFGIKRNVFLFIHHNAIPEKSLSNRKDPFQKQGYIIPNGNMTLDNWL